MRGDPARRGQRLAALLLVSFLVSIFLLDPHCHFASAQTSFQLETSAAAGVFGSNCDPTGDHRQLNWKNQPECHSVALFDCDEDGYPEAFRTSYWHNGSGFFGELLVSHGSSVGFGSFPLLRERGVFRGLAVSRDSTGRTVVAVVALDGSVKLFASTGAGSCDSFTGPTIVGGANWPEQFNNVEGITLADIDVDGKLDLFAPGSAYANPYAGSWPLKLWWSDVAETAGSPVGVWQREFPGTTVTPPVTSATDKDLNNGEYAFSADVAADSGPEFFWMRNENETRPSGFSAAFLPRGVGQYVYYDPDNLEGKNGGLEILGNRLFQFESGTVSLCDCDVSPFDPFSSPPRFADPLPRLSFFFPHSSTAT
jgi:hypothetical protein